MSSPLKPETVKLHGNLIRLAKGMISAWEEWLYGEDWAKEKARRENEFKAFNKTQPKSKPA